MDAIQKILLPTDFSAHADEAFQDKNDLDMTCINTIRTLSMDGVQAANSGHQERPWPWRRWPIACGSSSCASAGFDPSAPPGRALACVPLACQILANLAMEPPAGIDSESVRDEKVKVLKEIPPVDPDNLVRGQFVGYRREKGVASDSKVETFAALRLAINSWRWHGVPFYIRAGKELPVTCTEVFVQFRRPPAVYSPTPPPPNYLRFRISPDVAIAQGVMVMTPKDEMAAAQIELLAFHHPGKDEIDAYERLLGDALKGDATLFAREDYVEEAWRIVDPVLKAGTPVDEYEPQTWGPRVVDQKVLPPGGWRSPVVKD